jgi:NAD-dependent dihydropyrimidine dehydrogenase PreA subunit
MKIDEERCIGCKACHPYCPLGAIATLKEEEASEVVQEDCVECGVCLRAQVCPTDAIFMPDLEWPRSIRATFSDPLSTHPSTKEMGRGTEEMKTNDVTGRFRLGMAGMGVEMGRPSLGATFTEIQTVCTALAQVGVEFEPQNPVTSLMVDKRKGRISDEVLNEKVLSAIVEFSIENHRLPEALTALKEVSSELDTVFSLCLINRIDPDGDLPNLSIATRAGFSPRPNTKTNVGLGRPLKEV